MSRMTRQQTAREARLAEFDRRVEQAVREGHGHCEAIKKETRLALRTVDTALQRLNRRGRVRFVLHEYEGKLDPRWVVVTR